MNRPPHEPQDFLILCVEDENDLRANILEELADAGYRVQGAEDGQVALDQLAQSRPDLILCDITMPRMDGQALLKAVRSKGGEFADTPFLFLTALSDRLAVIEGKSAGADDYLVKPIDFDLMLATIRSRLDQVVRIRTALDSAAEQRRLSDLAAAQRQGFDALARALGHITLGVVLFDGQRQVVHKNTYAETILNGPISYANGRFSAGNVETSSRLQRALDAAIAGQNSEVMALSQHDQHPILVQMVGLGAVGGSGAGAVMFLLDTASPPALSEKRIAALFGLTPTEARVATAIAQGARTDEIATTLSISQTTLAFHMRNIFRKAGVSRQQDLVALIFRGSVLLDEAH